MLSVSQLTSLSFQDNKHGVSNRFTQALSNFDSKYKATDKAKGLDTNYGISEKGGRAVCPSLYKQPATMLSQS